MQEESVPLLRKRLFPGTSDDHHGPQGSGAPNPIARPGAGANTSANDSFRESSPIYKYPIQRSFYNLKKLTTTGSPSDHRSNELLLNPDKDFDKITQRVHEYILEVQQAIIRFKDAKSTEMDLLDSEVQIEKTLGEVSKIAAQLKDHVDETSERRVADATVSPRVLSAVRSREVAVNEIIKAIRDTRMQMQIALTSRERKDLLNEWSPFDRSLRRHRDAEEITSDATERLLNSKRILLETVEASSGTLSSLASSSQSVQRTDQELQTQNYMISTARSLLKKYGRRASTDKILIWLAVIFFGVVVLMVAFRRLL